MKKTYLRCAVGISLLSSSLLVYGQAAGGGAGAAAGGTVGGAGAPATPIGGASIARPSAPTVGGASAIQTSPNTIGGTAQSGGVIANPASPTPNATLPTGVPTGVSSVQGAAGATAPAIPLNTLPPSVQGALRAYSANGALGSVTPVSGRAGTYRATVTQNGVPMELILAANGQVLSRAPVSGSATATAGTPPTDAGALANVQAGIPLTSLPPALQNSIQSQLRGATVQSISRDDVGNGSVLRVTALQNGVPTEMRFAANGTLISATPLTGTATSTLVPGGTLLPGTAVVMDDLPASVQSAVREQLRGVDANRIVQQRTADGVNYVVSYDQDGRPMTMVVGPDGRIISNGPANVSIAARARTETRNESTNAATRTTMMKLDEVPDTVENALKQVAPYAEVRTISREQRVGGDVYVISVRDGDRAGEISIDSNGKVIRDNRRDLSALTPSTPPPAEDKPEGMPYDTLPVAIQNAVKAYASASNIRSITLGLDRDGRTIYDVIFYRDGRRDRMIVGKDGTLKRIEENVSSALELASSRPPVLAIGDLPQEVQDTIRRQTDNVRVQEIKTKQVANETVYQVLYETNGAPVELLVDNDGEIVLPEGRTETELADSPTPAGIDREERDPARIVDATQPSASIDTRVDATEVQVKKAEDNLADDKEDTDIDVSVGAAATPERGVSVKVSTPAGDRPVSKMNLKDTPEPVQTAAKRIAGSGAIESVTPRISAGGVTYEVNYMENGKLRTVTLDRDGVVQKQPASAPLK